MVIIALGAVGIGFAFRSLLIEQAKASVRVVADDIGRVAEATNALGFYDATTTVDMLSSKEQLDHWASPTQYIQIDTLAGYPIGKSSNTGSFRFAPIVVGPQTPDLHYRFTDDANGTPLIVLDRVFRREGKPFLVAHIGERLDIIERETRRAISILVVAAAVAMVAVVVASAFIARAAVDPIRRLTEEMAQIGSARLDRRLRWTRRDELGRLADSFDAMLDRLQESFARERQFIADASHELKTPLTVINANAQLLKRWGDRDPDVRAESVEAIIDESTRLASMVGGMLTLAKADSGDRIPREPVDLRRLADDVVAHSRERANAKELALTVEPAGGEVPVLGDAGLLRQLVANLVDNAIKFTESGGVTVAVEGDGDVARLIVSDTGIGIEPETAERLFDRFFRADASHSRSIDGTGLGLAIVRSIARVHGGTVKANRRPEGGSAFVVELPALTPPPVASFTQPQ